MIVKLTNTLDRVLIANYRMPSDVKGKVTPVLQITLQPRALLNEVGFPNESYYEQFKRQNEQLFTKGILIEGKASEKEILAKNKENIEAEKKVVAEKVDKAIDNAAAAADNVQAELTIDVDKAGERKKGKK